MGTHFHDQPPEHWAGPASLDPTPVWKQYIVVAVLLVLALVIIGIVSVPAILPTAVTPPSVVPGGRVVLAHGAIPAVAGEPVLVANGNTMNARYFWHLPLDEAHSFWLVQPRAGEYVAVRAMASGSAGAPSCFVFLDTNGVVDLRVPLEQRPFFEACPERWLFGARGQPLSAPRSLPRYLVSVTSDRVIVNVSDEIPSYLRTPAPSGAPARTP